MEIVHQMLIICFLLALPVSLYSQAERKYIRQGNREYGKEKYSDSEISYRRAIDKNSALPDAIFNIGDALYKQKKYEDAGRQFIENHNMNENAEKKSASLYNLGNSLLMSNKVRESIDAYKGSLKLDPDNMKTKYNLAYAQDLLKEQQQQQQQQQQGENKDNQDKKDQDKENQNQQKNDQQQKQQQPEQQTISKEDAERILNALANDEKDVQEKVKLAKARKEQVRTLKNW